MSEVCDIYNWVVWDMWKKDTVKCMTHSYKVPYCNVWISAEIRNNFDLTKISLFYLQCSGVTLNETNGREEIAARWYIPIEENEKSGCKKPHGIVERKEENKLKIKNKKLDWDTWTEEKQQERKDAENERRRREGAALYSCVSFLSGRKRESESKEKKNCEL